MLDISLIYLLTVAAPGGMPPQGYMRPPNAAAGTRPPHRFPPSAPRMDAALYRARVAGGGMYPGARFPGGRYPHPAQQVVSISLQTE